MLPGRPLRRTPWCEWIAAGSAGKNPALAGKHGWKLGEGRGIHGHAFSGKTKKTKKEEFLGTMENMLSRNSFPQICVVSVNQFVGNRDFNQEHVRSRALSNHYVYFLDNILKTN
jgi:hypothetical protein